MAGPTVRSETRFAASEPPLISWGAVLAGLVCVVAFSWLLYLFGMAIGVSIADGTDMAALGKGLGIGSIIWILFSSLVAYFLGAMLTARLAGRPVAAIGMLHGVTLWGAATALTLVLSFAGASALMQTGASVAKTTVSTVAGAGELGGGAADRSMAAMQGHWNDPLALRVQAQIKSRAAKALASSDATGSVTPGEAQRALNQLDASAVRAIGSRLLAGDTEGAKDVLTIHTTLSEQEVESLVEGVSQDMDTQFKEVRESIHSTIESASTYLQALLWTLFVASALALVACLAGGYVGATSAARMRGRYRYRSAP